MNQKTSDKQNQAFGKKKEIFIYLFKTFTIENMLNNKNHKFIRYIEGENNDKWETS